MLLLWLFIALAQEDTGLPSEGGGGTIGVGLGGGFGSFSAGTYEPPPPPERVPLGDRVDGFGRLLPEMATARLGDGRWSAGQMASRLEVHDGRLLTAGEDGAALFDTKTGVLIERLADKTVTAIGFDPEGQHAWIAMFDDKLLVAGEDVLQRGCWNLNPFGFGFTAAGDPVHICGDELRFGEHAIEVDGDRVATGANQILVWPMNDAGGTLVSLKGQGKVLARYEGVIHDADWHDKQLARIEGDTLWIGDDQVKIRAEHLYEVVWAPDGSLLALHTGEDVRIVTPNGKERCQVPVSVRGDLAWGDVLWVGDHEGTTPTRIDPARCEVISSGAGEAWTEILDTPAGLLTGNGDTIALWDPDTGEPRGQVRVRHDALGLLDGNTVSIARRGAGLQATLSLPELTLTEQEDPDGIIRFPEMRLLTLGGRSGPVFPTQESVAAGGPVVAWGLEDFTVRNGEQLTRYVFTDYVNLAISNPHSMGAFGMGLGFGQEPPPEPDPNWDGSAVRPRKLHLVDVDVTADGKRIAMLWTFLVTGAYGDTDQQYWLGILDPSRDALAGKNLRGSPDWVDISDDGTHVLWDGSRVTGIQLGAADLPGDTDLPEDTDLPMPLEDTDVPLDPEDLPDTDLPRDAVREQLELDQKIAVDAGLMGILSDQSLGDPLSSTFGETDWSDVGLDGMGGIGSPIHRGLAQRLPEQEQATFSGLQGRVEAVAISASGEWVAVGTTKETALFAWGEVEPVWSYDLGQGGASGLAFVDDVLWVLGSDGTLLSIPVED